VRFDSPPEYSDVSPPRRIWAPSLGFLPPSRRQLSMSTYRGHPKPATFRPRRFSRPRRLPPSTASWVCFAPQPRPGFALQGFSLAQSRSGSSPAAALLSLTPCPCLVTWFPRARSARTRTLAFRAFLRVRIRCDLRGFRPLITRSPPELHPPSGSSSHPPPATSRWNRPRPSKVLGELRRCDLWISCETHSPVRGSWPSLIHRRSAGVRASCCLPWM